MLIRPSHAALVALAALSTSVLCADVPAWSSDRLARHAQNPQSQDTAAPSLSEKRRRQERDERAGRDASAGLLEDMFDALRVLQDEWYEQWLGCWPKANDWTMAVTATHVAGALHSLSRGLAVYYPQHSDGYRAKENFINAHFNQLVGYYFAQNYLGIRNEAYDDMLWVVLGWLDTIRFIVEHGKEGFPGGTVPLGTSTSTQQQHPPIYGALQNISWHGNMWIEPFGHRARIFWELASQGWDDKLCGGGMSWGPKHKMYKNAITNELFIAASMSMYLDFPGDLNSSPFLTTSGEQIWTPQDPKYLAAAINGYKWLRGSHMLNSQGLFTDGFHASLVNGSNTGDNACSNRNEAVYTYNQGVILSGMRRLFDVTGATSFLDDGYALIQNVINATGWDLSKDAPVDVVKDYAPGKLPPFRGLGRAGVLEDWRDADGTINQDGQAFKGIWMHHFTAFCAPLEHQAGTSWGTGDAAEAPAMPEGQNVQRLSPEEFDRIRTTHKKTCLRYTGWLQHNALAAWATRDSKGRIGGWWTVGIMPKVTTANLVLEPDSLPHVAGAVDYRNDGVPDDPVWRATGSSTTQASAGEWPDVSTGAQKPLRSRGEELSSPSNDPNDRGRGRTGETQSCGLAVLRALWELLQQSKS